MIAFFHLTLSRDSAYAAGDPSASVRSVVRAATTKLFATFPGNWFTSKTALKLSTVGGLGT
jgi:hypothetical protein